MNRRNLLSFLVIISVIFPQMISGDCCGGGMNESAKAGFSGHAVAFYPARLHVFPEQLVSPHASQKNSIIADHTVVSDFEYIPEEDLLPAIAVRALVRHASVGEGINWGLDCLAGNHPTNPSCKEYTHGRYERSNWVFQNRGNPSWREKVDDLVNETSAHLSEFDLFTMKFCYIDALGENCPDFDYYREAMEYLEENYREKVFVWWTIPLTRDGQPGTDWFNTRVRDYAQERSLLLFDIADIEAYDSQGIHQTNSMGNEVISQEYTNEEHAGHLNVPGRIRVAKAFWWMMVKIAEGAEIEEDSEIGEELPVLENYPNPFSTMTVIRCTLPRDVRVTLRIYDSLGREVITLMDHHCRAGRHSIAFDGRGLPTGVYHAVLSGDGFTLSGVCRRIK